MHDAMFGQQYTTIAHMAVWCAGARQPDIFPSPHTRPRTSAHASSAKSATVPRMQTLSPAQSVRRAFSPTHVLAAATLILAVALLATSVLLKSPLWPLEDPHHSFSRLFPPRPSLGSPATTGRNSLLQAFSFGGSGGADGVAGGSRSLLHGTVPPETYPPCPSCELIAPVGNWWFGHCRRGGSILNCRRRKAGTTPPSAPGPPEFDQNLTTTAPFVACLSDADCALPFSGFVPVNRSIPLNTTGLLNAECALPEPPADAPPAAFADVPGICLCKYLSFEATIDIVELAVLSQLGEELPAPLLAELNAGLDVGFCFQRTPEGVDLSATHPAHPFFVLGDEVELGLDGGDSGGGGGGGVVDPEDFAPGTVVDVSIVDGIFDSYDGYGELEGDDPDGGDVEAVGPVVEDVIELDMMLVGGAAGPARPAAAESAGEATAADASAPSGAGAGGESSAGAVAQAPTVATNTSA